MVVYSSPGWPNTSLAICLIMLAACASGAIVCPDKESQCPDHTTCCLLDEGEYGCCPISHAVCCEDKLHCCPHATTCDTEHQRCLKGSLHLPIHRKHASQPIQSTGRRQMTLEFQKTQNLHHLFQQQANNVQAEVICPDAKSKCPSHTTCCPLNSPELSDSSEEIGDFVAMGPGDLETVYGCCPAEKAVCCADHLHCCPHGTTCDTEESRCIQEESGVSHPWLKKFESTKVVRKPAVDFSGPSQMTCHTRQPTHLEMSRMSSKIGKLSGGKYVEESTCPSGNTCCLHKEYNALTDHTKTHTHCCAHPDGECCATGTHCCPKGFKCTTLDKKCIKVDDSSDKYVLLSLKQTPTTRPKKQLSASEVESQKVECEDGSQCGPMNTCCPVRDADSMAVLSYNCCPLSQANCCSDSCCPIGYGCVDGKRCEKSSLNELISSLAGH